MKIKSKVYNFKFVPTQQGKRIVCLQRLHVHYIMKTGWCLYSSLRAASLSVKFAAAARVGIAVCNSTTTKV
jgi:hypothetical protein